MVTNLATVLGVGLGVAFVANLLLTAFGGTAPGLARRTLDHAVRLGVKYFLIYLGAMLMYSVFAGISVSRTVHSVLSNMFAVLLAVALLIVVLSDFLPLQKK